MIQVNLFPYAIRSPFGTRSGGHCPATSILAEKDMQAAKRAVVTIREAFRPLIGSPQIDRPVEEHPELQELVIDFGASGYLALYRFDSSLDTVAVLATKNQLEDDYR